MRKRERLNVETVEQGKETESRGRTYMEVVSIAEDGTEDETDGGRSHQKSEFCEGRRGQRHCRRRHRDRLPVGHFAILFVPFESVPIRLRLEHRRGQGEKEKKRGEEEKRRT